VQTPRWYPRVQERTAYPEVPVTRLAKERGGRLMRAGGGKPRPSDYLIPDIPMVYDLEDAQGITPLFPRDYDRYLRIIDNYERVARETNLAPPLFGPGSVNSPLLTALDVRTILERTVDPRMSPLFPLVRSGRPAVYARATPGHGVVVPEARPAGEERMWRAVEDASWNPEDTTAVLGLARPIHGGRGTARRVATAGDFERWEVRAPEGGFLRVAGNWDEGWSARVDGRRTPVLRADGIFRGVPLAPGRHDVVFRFRNPQEHRGRPVAVVAGLGILLLGAVPNRRRRLYSPPPVTSVTRSSGGDC
jgi:hypothetical protein